MDMAKIKQCIISVDGYLEGIMSIASTMRNYHENNEPGEYVNAKIAALSACVDTLALAAMEMLPNFTDAETEGK